MNDLIKRLRARTAPMWTHATCGTPVMHGHKPDPLCQEAADEIERLRADAEPMNNLDCRTCRNYTTKSGGCMSVLRCVDGSGYQRQGVVQIWEASPVSPAPF